MGTSFDLGLRFGENQANAQAAHKQTLSDEEFQGRLNEMNGNIAGLQNKLGMLQPGSHEFEQGRIALQNAIADRNAMFHPAVHPNALEKFGHTLLDHLHLTKPAAPPAPGSVTPEQLKAQAEANGMVAALPLTPEEQARRQAALQQQLSQQSRDWQLDWAKRNGISGDALNELTQHLAGVPLASMRPLLKPYKLPDGSVHYFDANHPDSIPQGATAIVPGGNARTSQYQTERDAYAHSIGKTPEQMTWEDERAFQKQLYGAKQPYAAGRYKIAQENEAIADANLKLRQSAENMKDFLALQKQIGPLMKIQTTASQAQNYVDNPSGPGDVALTFAYIEATKPNSGFRFTDSERRWILGTRGVVDGALTKINQGFTGETLSPEQRTQMAEIISSAAQQVDQQRDTLLNGAGAFNPTVVDAITGSTPEKHTPGSLKKQGKSRSKKGGSSSDDSDIEAIVNALNKKGS